MYCILVQLFFISISEAVVVEKEKPPMNVVGDVHNRIAIIVVSLINTFLYISFL